VGAVIGGVLTITSLTGETPHISWVVGLSILLVCLFIAVFFAYYDLYVSIELTRRTNIPSHLNRRRITNKEVIVIEDLRKQMENVHGHSDYWGIEQVMRDGVPIDEIMKQSCTKCGKPRNQKGDYLHD
jgi:hypothetical protein